MKRKGQDVIAQSIQYLAKEVVSKIEILIIGRECEYDVYKVVMDTLNKYPNTIRYIEEVSPEELTAIFNRMDALITSSRDDPLPIVVTDACSLSKPIVYSEFVGTSNILNKYDAGYEYGENSPEQLAVAISKCVMASESEKRIKGNNARRIYDELFSDASFKKALDSEFDLSKKAFPRLYDVSVVVPTYNPGQHLVRLVENLKAQNGINDLEIIVVDSGSDDDTVRFCIDQGIELIQIDQRDFTHSYSRNLGIERAKYNAIVVMTQDALPSNYSWLYSMIRPIMDEGCAAATCLEYCPKSADEFYKLCSAIHAKFLMSNPTYVSKHDITKKANIRQYASLNDVACSLNRDVFCKYKYRGAYAEDLDLGLRLIDGGYKLKYIKDNRVVHGHNRSIDYYFKRSYVENLVFNEMFGAINSDGVESKLRSMIEAFVAVGYVDKFLFDEKKWSFGSFVEPFSAICDEYRGKKVCVEVTNLFSENVGMSLLEAVIENLYKGKYITVDFDCLLEIEKTICASPNCKEFTRDQLFHVAYCWLANKLGCILSNIKVDANLEKRIRSGV